MGLWAAEEAPLLRPFDRADRGRATPDGRGGLPDGARPLPPDAFARLEQVAAPTLVVVATHDPPSFVDVGRTAARRIPGARLVEVDSDHYLTLRRPQEVGELLLEFLTAAAPSL